MEDKKKVIIYVRVSSLKQVRDGNGLDSQEQSCREWVRQHGYIVENVFREEGISGSKEDRPAFKEMLNFLITANENYIVLAMDISRFARDVAVYASLRDKIRAVGHIMQTVNMTLEETEESELLENVSSALGQYERKKNKTRTIKNMGEHLKQGFWVMRAIVGHQEVRKNGKIHHVRNEPSATYIQEALEGFANCRFLTQKEVFDFLKDKPLTIFGGRPVKLTYNAVKNILTNERYTGYFAYKNKNYDIPYQKWVIEPIISLETYQAIQYRLNGKKATIQRKYNTEDEAFPLRRFVCCSVCGSKMTASSPSSKSKKRHPYYHCYKKGCPNCGKGVRKADMHTDLESLLHEITPNEPILALVKRRILESHKEQTQDLTDMVAEKQSKITALNDEKRKTFELLMKNGDVAEIASMCRERITTISEEIVKLENETSVQELETMPLNEAVAYVVNFMTRPLQIWQTGDYHQKQGVLNLCFDGSISYDRAEKFGTPKLSPIFAVFSENNVESEKWRAQKDSNPQSSDP